MKQKIKTKSKTKTTNKSKAKNSSKNLIVNVQVNSHNTHKRKETKPLHEQAKQHTPQSTVLTHYFTPQHNSSHSEVNNLYKELLKDRDNQLTSVKNEMKIFKDELERVKNASAKPEEDDNSSVSSFPSIQNDTVANYNNDSEPIVEKGGGKTPYKTPAKNRGIMSLFKVKPEEKEEEAQPELGGRAHSEPAPPTGNSLAVSVGKEERTPLRQAGITEEDLRKKLTKLDKKEVRGIFRTIVGTDAPSAMDKGKIINKLLADYREATARNLSAVKDITR